MLPTGGHTAYFENRSLCRWCRVPLALQYNCVQTVLWGIVMALEKVLCILPALSIQLIGRQPNFVCRETFPVDTVALREGSSRDITLQTLVHGSINTFE